MAFEGTMEVYEHMYRFQFQMGKKLEKFEWLLINWNSLPIDIKKGTCLTSLRKAIYSHFLMRYNDIDHFNLSET